MNMVREAWNAPLFQSIMQRRARRFPLGAEMPGGVAPFKSTRAPVPLDEIEEAMLVMVATGLSGMNLADLPFNDAQGNSWCGNTMIQFTGRTYASPCGSHGTELFFTNDEGAYLVKMRDKLPEKVAEFEDENDMEKIITAFRANTVKIVDRRLDIPMVTPITTAFNQWNVNKPGTTLFMPVTDVTWEYINIMMLVMDAPNSAYIYDDMNGNAEPLKKFADQGLLDKTRAYKLSQIEALTALNTTGPEQALMEQNMYLAAQAMGLGGWIFGGSAGPVVMGGTPLTPGLGFRFQQPEKAGPMPGPSWAGPAAPVAVGLDGLFEAYCPPYYRTMADAAQAIYDAKWGTGGIYYDSPTPLQNRQSLDLQVSKTSDWCLEATKTLCQYIWDTYGRFPATMDPMQMNIWFQAHHLETDFYDTYYQPGAYHQNIADHMSKWHSPVGSRAGEPVGAASR
jgi:hypothetical protein